MKNTLFILVFLLLTFQTISFANAITFATKLDTTTNLSLIVVKDSLKTTDSLRVFKKQKITKIIKMSVLGALAASSGYGALLFGLDTNGYPMVFFGFLCIGLVFSILKIKKRKPKTYDELKIKESEPLIKKTQKFNKSWNYSLYIGLLGFSCTLISFLTGISIGFLFLPLFLSSLLFFILGFKGKYDSPQHFRNKLLLGFLGLLLHWLPFIVLIAFYLLA